MFETESKEYANNAEYVDIDDNGHKIYDSIDIELAHQKGAELGYKKGQSDQLVHKQYQLNQLRKANEWHNLEKDPNDLPKKELEEKQLLARVRNYEEDYIFAYYMLDKYNSLSGKRFYSDISCDYPIYIKDIIAWKEIVPPSEPMRSLDKEEQKNYTEAINKVYKPTGVRLFDKESE